MRAVEGDDRRNLKQVAQELGVHYMTAYRYVRTGQLAAEREGTGWVVAADVLEAFRQGRSTEAGGPVDRVEQLHRHLVAGDEPGTWAVIERTLMAGWTAEQVLVELLAPAVARTTPEEGAAAGHLAATTAQRAAATLTARFRRPGRHRGTIVLGAPPGEGHSLALALLTDLLRIRNVHVRELGGHVPAAAFIDAAARAERLLAIGIGVTDPARLGDARDVMLAVREMLPGVPMILGGQALADADLAAFAGADAWAADLPGVVDLVEDLITVRKALRGRHPAGADSAETV